MAEMNYAALFHTKFARVHLEIDALRSEVRLQKGAWIFTRHVHTREALLESPRLDRIHSICEKIGDDVLRWIKQDRLQDEDRPTNLEKWLSVFEVTALVLQTLPTVAKLLQLLLPVPIPTKLLPSGTD